MPNPQTPQEKLKRLLAEKAECEKSLALYRKLIKTNPDAIKAPLAMTLHKLAIINKTFGTPHESETQFCEAVAIYRELAAL